MHQVTMLNGPARRPGRSRWSAVQIGLALLVGFLSGGDVATADTILEFDGSRLRVEGITATPARKGERSELRFRIVNDGFPSLHLLGVRSNVAPQADLIARTGEQTEAVLTSFPIPGGEEMDLMTSHLRFELHPVNRDLVENETFTAILDFVHWTAEVPVHVHGSRPPSPSGEG